MFTVAGFDADILAIISAAAAASASAETTADPGDTWHSRQLR